MLSSVFATYDGPVLCPEGPPVVHVQELELRDFSCVPARLPDSLRSLVSYQGPFPINKADLDRHHTVKSEQDNPDRGLMSGCDIQ